MRSSSSISIAYWRPSTVSICLRSAAVRSDRSKVDGVGLAVAVRASRELAPCASPCALPISSRGHGDDTENASRPSPSVEQMKTSPETAESFRFSLGERKKNTCALPKKIYDSSYISRFSSVPRLLNLGFIRVIEKQPIAEPHLLGMLMFAEMNARRLTRTIGSPGFALHNSVNPF